MCTNIVCTANLGCPIDLRDLTNCCENIRYNPKTFSAAFWKHLVVGGTCMIFANGKICVNGKTSTPEDAQKRVRRYARLVQKRGWPVVLKSIKIITMSAYYRVECTLSMDALVRGMNATFDPELFPAAMLKREGIHVTCFSNGKILVTGIRNERKMEDVVMPTLIELELLGTIMM
jgi:transcription initiation factor TFIID TATA-box-binding protein